jgi:glycopeptide antibiotics resistance protein
VTSHIQDIAEPPVLIPMTVVAIAVLLWQLHRRGSITILRSIVVVAACVYGAGVLKEVLEPFQIGFDGPRPGWRVFIHLTPLAGAEISDMFLNTLLFLPLGVFLPLLARVSSARRIMLLGLATSLAIELTQFVLDLTVSTGRVADINDLLSDTVGALIGYGLLRLAVCIPLVGRLATAATWPAALAGTLAGTGDCPEHGVSGLTR